MSSRLSKTELENLERKFSYLVNYESDDPDAPIDPLSYVDSNGDTCLHLASRQGDLEAVSLLLKGGVDVNQKGDMDNTSLHYANKKGHQSIIDSLLAHGADPDLKNLFGHDAKPKTS